VVLGPIADAVAMEMRASAGPLARGELTSPAPVESTASMDPTPWLNALGGKRNVAEAGCAASRVWLRLQEPDKLDEAALAELGVRMIARPTRETVQLLVENAEPIAAALQPA